MQASIHHSTRCVVCASLFLPPPATIPHPHPPLSVPPQNPADFYIRTIQNHADTVLSAWASYRPSSRSPPLKLPPTPAAAAAAIPPLPAGGALPSTLPSNQPSSTPATPHHRDEQQSSPCRLGCHVPLSGLAGHPHSHHLTSCTCGASGSTSAASSQHSSSSSLHHPGLIEAAPGKAHGNADWLRKQRGEVMANSMLWETGVLLCRMLQDAGQDPVKLLAGVAIEAAGEKTGGMEKEGGVVGA